MSSMNALPKTDERRASPRVPLGRTGTIRLPGEPDSREVVISNLTRDGCRIEVAADFQAEDVVVIGVPSIGRVASRIVHRDERGYGCAFLEPLPKGGVTAAYTGNNVAMFPGQPSSTRQRRPERGNLAVGIGIVAAISLVGWAALAVVATRLL